MACFARVGFSKNMIALFGGIRFRYMHLFDVGETQLLLRACAGTLETLRLCPDDPRGEQLHLKDMRFSINNLTAKSSPLDFDLSRNKSLRTFEVGAQSITYRWKSPAPSTLGFLRTVFSTITSPAFFEVIVIYLDRDFGGAKLYSHDTWGHWKQMTPAEGAEEASWHRVLFEVFREMYTVRDFRLVLAVEARDRLGEYTVGAVKRAVATENATKRLDYLPSEPAVVYSPQSKERWVRTYPVS